MVMVFTLVSAVQERLGELVDEVRGEREREEQRLVEEQRRKEEVCVGDEQVRAFGVLMQGVHTESEHAFRGKGSQGLCFCMRFYRGRESSE